MAYAHSRNENGKRHDLREHLEAVARLAEEYAGPFGGGSFARWAGLLHDIGKANPAFQRYLEACEREPTRRHKTVDHKGAGSLAAFEIFEGLAFLIDGHHGGLPDKSALKTKRKELRQREETRETLAVARADGLVPATTGALQDMLPQFAAQDAFSYEFFLRMAFSALVDADHLDTERHFSPARGSEREGMPDIALLHERLQAEQAALSGRKDDPVNRVRDEVYRACISAAREAPGFFRLTVPTGGGKTRSGLAFALAHALGHGLRRVVVAVPFLTITDQTADVYRGVLGSGSAVLEDHSGAMSREDSDGSMDAEATWRRLAAQTWDAPVIVTTTVQLFESLLGRSTGSCRKLHRLARSVIILDEVQTLPPTLLEPILSVLQELVDNYGTTVVFCTATQPAFARAPGFARLQDVREIVPDPERHFRALERVRYEWPAIDEEAWTWDQVAEAMRDEPRALTIVNTKAQALALLDALNDPEAFHLSTLLCGAHRRDVLALIRQRLAHGEQCHVVSTQVVEAGVDIDFPMVLRALGPLDRIVQAAGRCNREGLLELGRVVVFRPEDESVPPGAYRTATNVTEGLLRGGLPDMNDPALFDAFFGSLFPLVDLDANGVQPLRKQFEFEKVARAFRLIDDDTVSVVVPYVGMPELDDAGLSTGIDHQDRVRRLIAELEQPATAQGLGAARAMFARAQPYVVALRRRHAEQMMKEGLLTELRGGLWRWHGGYDQVRGLVGAKNPEELVL